MQPPIKYLYTVQNSKLVTGNQWKLNICDCREKKFILLFVTVYWYI